MTSKSSTACPKAELFDLTVKPNVKFFRSPFAADLGIEILSNDFVEGVVIFVEFLQIHMVLGKKKGSLGVGHPGLSRKRAYEQRTKTIGVEHERLGKVNKWNLMTRYLRFTAERVKHLKKGSKFNLTDDYDNHEDTLTHGGKALTSIQKFDKTIASDDEDDVGNIGADVVKVAHFGGGDLDSTTTAGEKLSRKDVIADLIARTRQARENKQNAKDDMETITEELDAKYLKILDKVKETFRPVGATKSEKVTKDDYDTLALTLKFDADARATPAERTKTAEELAAEEKLHLEELESLRIARMNAEKNKRGHVSVDADNISDGPRKKSKKDGFEVRFDSSGAFLDKDKVEHVTKKKVAIDSDDELTDEEMEDENEEDLDDLIDENDVCTPAMALAAVTLAKCHIQNLSVLARQILLVTVVADFVEESKRLIASLFPVSDKWHPVCTPAMALAAVTLAKCHIQNLSVLARQILLVTVVADFVEESKRFVPEAVAFCQGALLMAVENEENERAPSTAFPISLPHRRMLYIVENLPKDAAVEPLKFSEVFNDDEWSY
ncbi:hypothetical protein NECAME_16827 [Necator americanus]|uniref:Nop14-like family protein n=1 Tax=Necator americanus TaxID=51031 RepID=W2TU40_NECAM|nr:hypothetical protein NECAME_16827 [Necator americanus]ETN85288.1 hypothetical protein NECAME_16827 [Necator americanus]